MAAAGIGLRELHQQHLQLKDVHDQLERGPRQIAARQRFSENKAQGFEEARGRLTDLKRAADGKNLDLKSNENKIDELRRKLNVANSNREFDVIKTQIDADTMANSVLEDEILECLDKIDQAQVVMGLIEKEHKEAESEAIRIAEEVANAKPALDEEATKLEAEIEASEKNLPPSVFTDYRRLVVAHGASALATIHGSSCASCYVTLLPQAKIEVNSGKIVFCKNCGRLLYPAEET